jgi:hypothetical protein
MLEFLLKSDWTLAAVRVEAVVYSDTTDSAAAGIGNLASLVIEYLNLGFNCYLETVI